MGRRRGAAARLRGRFKSAAAVGAGGGWRGLCGERGSGTGGFWGPLRAGRAPGSPGPVRGGAFGQRGGCCGEAGGVQGRRGVQASACGPGRSPLGRAVAVPPSSQPDLPVAL